MAVDPRGADLKRYLAEDPGGPIRTDALEEAVLQATSVWRTA
jgi:hypothetical protein